MNLLKRAKISIFRQSVKSVILLLLVIILGSTMAGAIAVTNAMGNTEHNLRRQLRPIVTFLMDTDGMEEAWVEAGGYWETMHFPGGGTSRIRSGASIPWPAPITRDVVHSLATLPQVADYHYAISKFLLYGLGFREFLPHGASATQGGSMQILDEVVTDVQPLYIRGAMGDQPLELSEGLIELAIGSDFHNYQELLQNPDAFPVLVSNGWANRNDLTLGSTFNFWVPIIHQDDEIGRASCRERV